MVLVGAEAGKQWRAPALSSLVNRLAQPAGKQPYPSSPSPSKPKEEEHYLDPSSDEEEQAAASAKPQEDASSAEGGLSIYSAAAGPFRALLACIAAEPGTSVAAPLMRLTDGFFHESDILDTGCIESQDFRHQLGAGHPTCGILCAGKLDFSS